MPSMTFMMFSFTMKVLPSSDGKATLWPTAPYLCCNLEDTERLLKHSVRPSRLRWWARSKCKITWDLNRWIFPLILLHQVPHKHAPICAHKTVQRFGGHSWFLHWTVLYTAAPKWESQECNVCVKTPPVGWFRGAEIWTLCHYNAKFLFYTWYFFNFSCLSNNSVKELWIVGTLWRAAVRSFLLRLFTSSSPDAERCQTSQANPFVRFWHRFFKFRFRSQQSSTIWEKSISQKNVKTRPIGQN